MRCSRPLAFLFAGMLLAQGAHAADCTAGTDAEKYAPKTLWAFIQAYMDSNPPCNSARTILEKVVSHRQTGGRKLEPDKPFDPREAQKNLDAAFADSEVRKRLDGARAIADPKVRTAYEAAILDDEGFYAARELKIRELQAGLNP